jgi:hypothetical protein
MVFVFLQLALAGCGNKEAGGEGGIEGLGKYKLSLNAGRASLSVVFENLQIDAGVRIPLTRPEGAFVELGPDFDSPGTLFVISVPISSLIQGNGDLPLAGLPDGRPLPAVTSGVLGVLPLKLPLLGETYLYLGTDVFGIFFPLSLPNLPVMVKVNIRDEKGNLLGVLFGIPEGAKGSISGALFLFPVEASVSQGMLMSFWE